MACPIQTWSLPQGWIAQVLERRPLILASDHATSLSAWYSGDRTGLNVPR